MPIRAGFPIIDRTTALHSAIGTLAALLERNISGQGQSIDVCLADSGYSFRDPHHRLPRGRCRAQAGPV